MTSGRPERPQIVAHRGASGALAEHTLAAYLQALDDGADAVECDVRLTADGHLVCVHDRRVERTSNGRGVVSALQLAELDALDFGSWKNPWADLDDEADDGPHQRKVLTLEALLGELSGRDRRVELAVETKHPTRYAGLVEQRLVDLLARFGLTRPGPDDAVRVSLMSFSRISLRRVRELAPAVPTVWLMDRLPLRFGDGTLPRGCRAGGVAIPVVRAHPGFVRRLQRRGNAVHVFTVNDRRDVDLCLRLGVDAIITDHPADTLSWIRRQTGPHGGHAP